jgi:hypothetical protein
VGLSFKCLRFCFVLLLLHCVLLSSKCGFDGKNTLYFNKLYFAKYCDCQIVSKGALFCQNLKMELVLLSYNHLSSHVFLLVKGVMSLLCS